MIESKSLEANLDPELEVYYQTEGVFVHRNQYPIKQEKNNKSGKFDIMLSMKKKGNASVRNVLVVLDLSNASGREYLIGISQWAKTHAHWNISLMQPSDNSLTSALTSCDNGNTSGIICSETRVPATAILNKSKLPLTIIGDQEGWIARRAMNVTFVRDDDEHLGKYVAQRFITMGKFASFGFVPHNQPYYWSNIRKISFCDEISRSGNTPHVFRSEDVVDARSEVSALGKWLRSLPKPAAVMVAYDRKAPNLFLAAKLSKIKIPEQLSVIGVDNDETICDFCDPSLSSVTIDHVHVGELAAEALERLMKKPSKPAPSTILMKKINLVERSSTTAIPPATQLVRDALLFIENNASRDIGVKDVVANLKVSRRLADLRFHQLLGTTILHAIQQARLNKVRTMLLKGNLPIKKITAACGFANEFNVKRLFKKAYGISMRDYRRKNSRMNSPM